MLWDRITLANFLGGLAVAAVLLVVFPLPPVDRGSGGSGATGGARPPRPPPCSASWSCSNVFMTREIVTPQRQLDSGVVRCPMRTDSPKMLSTVANILALSPGTMAVDATDGPPALFVHVSRPSATSPGDVRRQGSAAARGVRGRAPIGIERASERHAAAGRSAEVPRDRRRARRARRRRRAVRRPARRRSDARRPRRRPQRHAASSAWCCSPSSPWRRAGERSCPVLVLLAVVGFLGTAMIARFLEGRGR